MKQPALDRATATRFAAIALANLERPYPHRLDHLIGSDADCIPPRVLHPSFHTSYDWHSCVHMHWLLARLRRRHPDLPQRRDVDAALERSLAPDAIAGECAYFGRAGAASFARTYGWAWLLKLHEELARLDGADAERWSAALAPLARIVVARYVDYLPKARYPIRHGVHANTAFGLAFALDYARRQREPGLERLGVASSCAWYRADRDAPAAWEPSASDFLSPVLIEAALMHRILDGAEFAAWLSAFLPGFARGAPRSLFAPVQGVDRADPQLVHLDGLNLSRAWCLRGIAAALPPDDPRGAVATASALEHLEAGLAGVASAEFVGAHWLASFAALALDD